MFTAQGLGVARRWKGGGGDRGGEEVRGEGGRERVRA